MPLGRRPDDIPPPDDAALVEIGGRLFLAPLDGRGANRGTVRWLTQGGG
jgi:hypothetical protein